MYLFVGSNIEKSRMSKLGKVEGKYVVHYYTILILQLTMLIQGKLYNGIPHLTLSPLAVNFEDR